MPKKPANCQRRDGVFWFRRRVRSNLAARLGFYEIHRSLGTTCPKEAARRARYAWLLTEDLFDAMDGDASLTAEFARLILRKLVGEPLHESPTADGIVRAFVAGDPTQGRLLFNQVAKDEILRMPAADQARILQHMERIADKAELDVAKSGRDMQRRRAEAGLVREWLANEKMKLADESLMLIGIHEPPPPEAAPAPPAASVPAPAARYRAAAPTQPAPSTAPLFSACEKPFFAFKGYPAGTQHQNEATLRLWREIVGDRPMDQYVRKDATDFVVALRKLPSSHGKGVPADALAVIEASEGMDVRRLTDKTIKRHISCLKQLWLHVGEVANDRIFSNLALRVKDGERGQWSDELLDKLLRARWVAVSRAGKAITEDMVAWFIAIAGYTGCRLEEIARFRTVDAFQEKGVPCLRIQVHLMEQVEQAAPARPDTVQWMPKTENGLRTIPIPQKLLDVGIMDMIQTRRQAGEKYLFDLDESGPSNSRSGEFSREFSRHKAELGAGTGTVFHSFRHNVSTILQNTPLKQQWVDAYLGHASGTPPTREPGQKQQRERRKSTGEIVYSHGLSVTVMRQVADAVEYPDEICPTLLLRRVRGEVDW